MAELRRQTSWDHEKIRLGYQKLFDHFLKDLHTDRFCVRAMKTDHAIYSFRTEKAEGRKSNLRISRVTTVNDQSWDEAWDLYD